jgi:hypothetical protein
MKQALFLIFSVTQFFAFTQDDNYAIVDISWKLGDTKKIETVASTKTYVNGSLLSDTEVKSNYTISVVNVGDFYTLKYRQALDELTIKELENLEMDTLIQKLMIIITKNVSDFDYLVKFDPELGLATEIINLDKMIDEIEGNIPELVRLIDPSIPEEKMSMIKELGEGMINMMKPEITQTTINSINYTFQGYSFPFRPNDSYTQQIDYYDVNTLGALGNKSLPAMLTIEASESGNRLKLSTTTDVDKKAMIDAMTAAGKNEQNFTPEEVTIVEKENYEFDLNTSWILTHSSLVDVKFRNTVHVVQTSHTTFK